MRIAILDPAAGLSGDMLLGALIDVGVGREWLESLPTRLGFRDVRVHIRTAMRAGVRATKVDFDIPPGIAIGGSHHGAHVGKLVALIKKDPNLKSLPVMIVSYKDREEDRQRGLEAGADYYLTKGSFHDATLLRAVIDLIGAAAA